MASLATGRKCEQGRGQRTEGRGAGDDGHAELWRAESVLNGKSLQYFVECENIFSTAHGRAAIS